MENVHKKVGFEILTANDLIHISLRQRPLWMRRAPIKFYRKRNRKPRAVNVKIASSLITHHHKKLFQGMDMNSKGGIYWVKTIVAYLNNDRKVI